MAGSPPRVDMDMLIETVQSRALECFVAADDLPQDIAFHRSLDRQFRKDIEKTSARLLKFANRLIAYAETHLPPSVAKGAQRDGKARELQDEEDIADKYHSIIVDAMDSLLEHADVSLDIYTGKLPAPSNEQSSKGAVRDAAPKNPDLKKGKLPAHLLHAVNLPKPQFLFRTPINNANDFVWNHHPKRGPIRDRDASSLRASSSTHPYLHEILQISYPQHVFQRTTPYPPKSFEDTPFTWVSTSEDLARLLPKLRQASEIAVDLEHHSYRSYYGFVCLMQISTREEDFIIDALALREDLEDLNEIFVNPTIVKVFHGADSDIVWLQEDFDLYVVNLFDTYQASKVLELPRHSLAALLSLYCDFTADKRYQRADWRIRPLPEEMLFYARSDTHFLLYVYDRLRESLLERGQDSEDLVRKSLRNSEETALKEFHREAYDAETGEGSRGWAAVLRWYNKRLSGVQREVFLAMHAWRDKVAREEDESPLYVISNERLMSLVEKPVPKDLVGLHMSFGVIPPLVRVRGAGLLEVMKKAEERAESKTGMNNAPLLPSQPKPTNTHIVFDQGPVILADLWTFSKGGHQPLVRTSKSSLFGASTPKIAVALGAKTSSLFSKPGQLSTRPEVLPQKPNISDIVSKVHEGILKTRKPTIASVPILPPTSASAAESVGPSIPPSAILPAEEDSTSPPEAAPNPSSTTVIPAEADDTIVVVAQRKKRKRVDSGMPSANDSSAPQGGSEVRSTRKKKREEEKKTARAPTPEIQIFDYATAPNILDDLPVGDGDTVQTIRDARRGRGESKRGKKKGGLNYSNFGPAPRAMNEPKSGNKTHTF